MTIRLASHIVVVFVVCGCGPYFRSTHYLGPEEGRLRELNDIVEGRTCAVLLRDGSRYTATDLAIGRDSTRLRDTLSRRTFSVPNGEIRQVSFVDHLRGGLDGMTLGAGIGLGIYAGGVFLGSEGNAGNRGYLLLGALAIPAGFIAGSVIGDRHDIDYPGTIPDSAGSADNPPGNRPGDR